MQISSREWNNYIKRLSAINKKASDLIVAWVEQNGLDNLKALVDYAYAVAAKYGNASATLNALMYDSLAELEGLALPAAELAELPTYGDVAKSVYGTLKTSQNAVELGGAVGRLVKMTGQDTMLKNGIRDRAQFAWIPSGDTCAFCMTLASRGWQNVSAEALKGGHAQHIHSDCDCTYMIRHNKDVNIKGYDPDKYLRMYKNADTSSYGMHNGHRQSLSTAKINGMRREIYAKNKDEINAQKRAAYAKRKEAEEIKVD